MILRKGGKAFRMKSDDGLQGSSDITINRVNRWRSIPPAIHVKNLLENRAKSLDPEDMLSSDILAEKAMLRAHDIYLNYARVVADTMDFAGSSDRSAVLEEDLSGRRITIFHSISQ